MSTAASQWPRVKLGDVCEFKRGLTYAKADEVVVSNKVVLRSNNVNLDDGSLNFEELKFISESFPVPPDKIVKSGSILMCMANGSKAHLGKVGLIDKDYGYAFGGFMGLLLPNHSVLPEYLFRVLSSAGFKNLVKNLTDGASINNLKFLDISGFEFPLPPLSVQREIVAKLDKELEEADALAAKFKRLAEVADAEFKADLKETFDSLDGERVKLGEVCDVLDSKRKPVTKADRKPGPFPYYGATGVVDYVNDYLFDERLVLLGEDGAKWGPGDNSAFIIDGKSWVNNHAHVLRPSKQVVDRFLVYQLNNADLSESITGVTVPKLNQQKMCEITCVLPPIAVQRSILARLDAAKARCENLKKAAERGAKLAADLRKAILKETFE